MRKNLLYCLLAICTLTSCGKDKDPQPTEKVSEINFRYDTYSKAPEFELIIAEKNGKVLLDTVIATHKSHSLRVKSVESNFNVTTLLYNPDFKLYDLRTYLHVNPNGWHLNSTGSASAAPEKGSGTITYTNLPGYDDLFLFMARNLGYFSTTWSGSTLKVDYDRSIPVDVTYLLLPRYGKYLLTEVTSSQTTVDYRQALDAVKHKFNKPAGITNFSTYLYGYSDDGKYNRGMMLFGLFGAKPTSDYDLMYPATGFKSFDLEVTYHDADRNWHTYSHYSASIPSEIAFLGKSDFKVTQSEFADFRITLDTDKPSIYSTLWNSTDANVKANWLVYFPSSETSFKPQAFLKNLKFKMPAGNNLPPFKLSNVTSQKVSNFDHQAMLDNMFNATARKNNPIKSSRRIQKTF